VAVSPHGIRLEPFRSGDQADARMLVLRGLGEHWGWIDETRNPDLDDIGSHYAAGCFLVARAGGTLVGTGGFLPLDETCVQIHRVSVTPAWRRRGVGRAIVAGLLEEARVRGFRRAVAATTETWHEVIAFHRGQGFVPTARRDGDVHLAREL